MERDAAVTSIPSDAEVLTPQHPIAIARVAAHRTGELYGLCTRSFTAVENWGKVSAIWQEDYDHSHP